MGLGPFLTHVHMGGYKAFVLIAVKLARKIQLVKKQ